MKKLALLGLLAIAGCASVVHGPTQHITFQSQPTGATISLKDGAQCVTPCMMDLPRKDEITVLYTRAGCQPQTVTLRPELTIGNLISTPNDYASGAAYSLIPNPSMIMMNCTGGL